MIIKNKILGKINKRIIILYNNIRDTNDLDFKILKIIFIVCSIIILCLVYDWFILVNVLYILTLIFEDFIKKYINYIYWISWLLFLIILIILFIFKSYLNIFTLFTFIINIINYSKWKINDEKEDKKVNEICNI